MIAGYRWEARPLMIVLFLIFFSVFTGLSLWQVNRVFEKQGMAERIAAANRAEPVTLSGRTPGFMLEHLYYRAGVYGEFDQGECFFVENVIRNGKPGLYLYCPFRPRGDENRLLVNLGWMPRGRDRLDLPPVELPAGSMSIEGVINRPRSKPVVGASDQRPDLERPDLWAFFDFDYLLDRFGLKFYPVEFQLTSAVGPELQREWSSYNPKIGMHIGYAIHWAAFALVTLGLYIKFNFRKQTDDD